MGDDDDRLFLNSTLNPDAAPDAMLASDSELSDVAEDEYQRGFLTNLFGQFGQREVSLTRLSHYVLLDKLGQGGMGIVYAAFDEKLERKVAVKLLRSRGNPQAQQRLVREAQAMARLSHPNVVQIYEISEIEGTTFLVMEFVKGETLREWLDERPRSQQEILEVFLAAGRGLAAAHDNGLVHRDFKPDNVMIRTDGRVLVMDFGLAYEDAVPTDPKQDPDPSASPEPSERRAGGLAVSLTATGQLMGTPAYMAPEQFKCQETDARTDQFSFSVTLWEALHGKRPFEASSLVKLAEAVTHGVYADLDTSEVPPWLRAVVRRGICVAPEDRWPSLDAMLEALTKDPTRRRRWIAAGVVSAAIVLGGLAGTHLLREHQREQAMSACEQEGRALEEDWNQNVQDQIAAAFDHTGLEFAPGAWQHTRVWIDAYARSWTDARTEVCRSTKIEGQRDEVFHAMATACLDERRASFTGLLEAWADPDLAVVARATNAAASLSPVSMCTSDVWLAQRMRAPQDMRADVGSLRSRLERATALKYAGRDDDGLLAAQTVLKEARVLGWAPLEAEAWLAVGMLQEGLGSYEQARASVERAYLEASAAEHDVIALEACASLTWIMGRKLGQHEQGLRWGELGVALVRRLGLEDSLREATLLNNIGAVLRRQGALDGALESHRRALAIRERVLGFQHPDVGASLNNIGVVLWALGLYKDALAAHRQALDISEAALGTEHRYVAVALAGMGTASLELGELDDALESHRKALRIKEALLGPEHPSFAQSYNNIGVVLRRQGAYQEANESFGRAVSIGEANFGPRHPSVANSLTGLGRAHFQLGELERARAVLERAIAIWERESADPADLAEARFALAQVRWGNGQLQDARQLGQAALDGYGSPPDGTEAELAEVEAWLREHPIPTP